MTDKISRKILSPRGRPKARESDHYDDALKKIQKTRLNRRKNWNDDWRYYETEERYGVIRLKVRRLKTQAFSSQPNQEAVIDTLTDLANYTLFWLQLELEKRRDKHGNTT